MYYIGSIACVETDIRHFGIPGMEWGKRRWQYEDGRFNEAGKERYFGKHVNDAAKRGERLSTLRESHTIPKGTVIYRTTANKDEDTSGVKYVSYAEADRNHYKGGWIRQTAGADKAYENTYQLNEDLKVPGRDEVYSVVTKMLKDDPKLIKKTAEAWFDVAYPEGSWQRWELTQSSESAKEVKQKEKKFVDDLVKSYGSKTTSEAAFWCMQTFGKNDGVRSKLIGELKKRGYNAMTDEASVGGQNGWGKEGIDPLIVFDGGKSLGKTSTTEITRKEERRAHLEDQKWSRKAGQNRGGAW